LSSQHFGVLLQHVFGLQHFGFSDCISLVESQHPSVVQAGSLVGTQHPSVVQAGCLVGSQGLQQGLGHLGLQRLGLGQHLGLQHLGLGHLGLQHLGLGAQQPSPLFNSSSALFLPQRLLLLSYRSSPL